MLIRVPVALSQHACICMWRRLQENRAAESESLWDMGGKSHTKKKGSTSDERNHAQTYGQRLESKNKNSYFQLLRKLRLLVSSDLHK